MNKQLTIAGVTSGVGSMLIGAYALGYKVLGNVEWRNYYNTGTFELNFEAPYTTNYEDIDHLKGADVVMVHDDCGDFSGLNCSTNEKTNEQCKGKIPITIKAVKEISPKFFAMDNLPKMIEIFPASYWIEKFPDYDIYFEWISNYHYGNPQKNRKRFFIIGAKKELDFIFKPNEFDFKIDSMDIYSEDAELFENHYPIDLKDKITGISKLVNQNGDLMKTWQEYYDYTQNYGPKAGNLPYLSPDGTIKNKPGTNRNNKHYSMVITGGMTTFHHKTALPLTIRERATIQGFPEDFNFILTEKEHWSGKGFRQVGKAMPVQFTTYLANIFKDHLEGIETAATGQRMIAANKYIDKIKLDYCERVALPEGACDHCWLQNKCHSYL